MLERVPTWLVMVGMGKGKGQLPFCETGVAIETEKNLGNKDKTLAGAVVRLGGRRQNKAAATTAINQTSLWQAKTNSYATSRT
ncbi:MAG: hypothetical protein HY360_22245 [Verrucomicrobia bacterium]|nr:hypothetical protein [Verrucomicrobiota bacterium]